jgi:aryl sulfotransferase
LSGAGIQWPRKIRELRSVKFDSAVWNDFRFRTNDIIIATYEKAGTTWVQQIVAQLLFAGAADIDVQAISPWLDLRLPPPAAKLAMLEAQGHRRFVKTHLPVDALVYAPEAKYIYAARDGRDVAWSLYHHLVSYRDDYVAALNQEAGPDEPLLRKPAGSAREFFLSWMEQNGEPAGPFFDHVLGWWRIRSLPNLLLVHYNALKADPGGEIRRIAAFLGITVDPDRWPVILEHCSFPYMKAHAERFAPRGGLPFAGGAGSFIHKGTNGRWRDALSGAEAADYEAAARSRLGSQCADWLRTGRSDPLAFS